MSERGESDTKLRRTIGSTETACPSGILSSWCSWEKAMGRLSRRIVRAVEIGIARGKREEVACYRVMLDSDRGPNMIMSTSSRGSKAGEMKVYE